MAEDNVFSLEEFLRGSPIRRQQPMLPAVPQPVVSEYIPRTLPVLPVVPQQYGAVRALFNPTTVIAPMMVPPIQTQQPKQTAPKQQVGQGTNLSLQDITNIVRAGESGGDYTALNREKKGNTASGAYQYTDRTWNGYGGYGKAMLAPKEVQDRRFAEDIAARHKKYNGDVFKIIAEHYLPAAANNPSLWKQPFKLRGGQTVKPVAQYVAYVLSKAGNPELEKAFNEYLSQY